MSRAVFEPINMAQLVGNVAARREARGENNGIPISLQGQGGAGLVMGVPIRLERVVENLLDNAVSFSPEGGSIVAAVNSRAGRVEVSVCDEGPGVPEESREKVFTRFHSLRPEAEDFGDHSGLGLAIGRAIAEAHDGTLTVASRPDGADGACFILSLPAA